jgi:SAM-dependent methyltransferase
MQILDEDSSSISQQLRAIASWVVRVSTNTFRVHRIPPRVRDDREPMSLQPNNSKFKIREADLDNFIRQVDETGGPTASDFNERFGALRYVPSVKIDEDLDPYSPAYMQSMFSLYEEISGTNYNPAVTELMDFEIERHVLEPTAYGLIDPTQIALHFHRLSSAIRMANLPRGCAILDMGCGWGLSSEFLAQCGYNVTAVDINPKFVELVRLRSQRQGLPIDVRCSSFEDFQSEDKYDGIVFYECLHHAAKPWELIEKLNATLKDNGKFILAGEPIQDDFWRNWGLRLDSLSIYCIRKYGWFESGWSLSFLKSMLARCGMLARVKLDPDPAVGLTICAERFNYSANTSYSAADLLVSNSDEWIVEGTTLVSTGISQIEIVRPVWATAVEFTIMNHRGKPIAFRAKISAEVVYIGNLSPGVNRVKLILRKQVNNITFVSDKWSPAKELGSIDTRTLSFHLIEVAFMTPA